MSVAAPPQHAGLTPERWAAFSPDQRLLMIANELHRATRCLERGESAGLTACYERALRLTDLTVGLAARPTLCRELLRWRDLLAVRFLEGADAASHRALLAALLTFSPAVSEQRPYLLGGATT